MLVVGWTEGSMLNMETNFLIYTVCYNFLWALLAFIIVWNFNRCWKADCYKSSNNCWLVLFFFIYLQGCIPFHNFTLYFLYCFFIYSFRIQSRYWILAMNQIGDVNIYGFHYSSILMRYPKWFNLAKIYQMWKFFFLLPLVS